MPTYSTIEDVLARPRDINSGPPGWGFTLYGPMHDEEAPHRRLIERFAAAHPDAGIELPAYDSDEDFVEATAVWNGGEIAIYYETLLSYLWLWSPDRRAVTSFREYLLPLVS